MIFAKDRLGVISSFTHTIILRDAYGFDLEAVNLTVSPIYLLCA